MTRFGAALGVAAVLAGCAGRGAERVAPSASRAAEGPVEVLELCLGGPLASRRLEYSGMGWMGDDLVLLPQWAPRGIARHGAQGLFVATIPRRRIERWVDGSDRSPITPSRLALDIGDLAGTPEWQGFEAIGFASETQGVLVAEVGDGDHMSGLVVPFVRDGDRLRAYGDRRALTVPSRSDNHAFEAVTSVPGGWLAIFEANGLGPQCGSVATLLASTGLASRGVAFPSVPYRVTDATALDGEGRFWMPRYSYRDANDTAECERTIAARGCYGGEAVDCDTRGGATRSVEHLVEFRNRTGGVIATGRAMELRRDERPRNWEGIARLGDAGFVVVTDEWPRTILGFVGGLGRPSPTPSPPCAVVPES